MGPGERDIMHDSSLVRALLLGAQVAQVPRRAAGPELAGGNAAAGSQHRPGGEHRAALDLAAVHHDRAKADEAAVVEPAAVDHREMADQDVVADDRVEPLLQPRLRRFDLDDGPVLDVGARADPDPADVPAKHDIVPDAGLRPDLD